VLDDERQFVAADLPGLIAGAHQAGDSASVLAPHRRTRVLLFMVRRAQRTRARDLEILEREVSLHSPALLEKRARVVITKGDLLPGGSRGRPVHFGSRHARLISAQSGEGLAPLLEELWGSCGDLRGGRRARDEGEDE